jgi:glucokinase
MAADVGGTNSRFMLYQVEMKEEIVIGKPAPGKLLLENKYANIKFAQFADVVDEFLIDAKKDGILSNDVRPEVACLAVAGVAQQNRCRLTNLDWLIDGPALSQQFQIPTVEVINDFVGQGYGVLTLGDGEVIHLTGPAPAPGGTVACVGAGTGLGQCFLTPAADGEYQCFPSEGGHAEFAPRGAGNDETQIDMLRYLKVKFSGWNRISFERVVSGKGICNIYEFLAYKSPNQIDKEVHENFLANRQDAGIIAKNATPGTLCHEALQIFADCYGCACGTFALQIMPFGGLYLTGGVTQKLQSFLQTDGSFLAAYADKGRVSPMLQDVPLFFVKGDDMGQRGAHLRAVRLLHHYRSGIIMRAETKAQSEVHLVPPREAHLASLLKAAGVAPAPRTSVVTSMLSMPNLAPVQSADENS